MPLRFSFTRGDGTGMAQFHSVGTPCLASLPHNEGNRVSVEFLLPTLSARRGLFALFTYVPCGTLPMMVMPLGRFAWTIYWRTPTTRPAALNRTFALYVQDAPPWSVLCCTGRSI